MHGSEACLLCQVSSRRRFGGKFALPQGGRLQQRRLQPGPLGGGDGPRPLPSGQRLPVARPLRLGVRVQDKHAFAYRVPRLRRASGNDDLRIRHGPPRGSPADGRDGDAKEEPLRRRCGHALRAKDPRAHVACPSHAGRAARPLRLCVAKGAGRSFQSAQSVPKARHRVGPDQVWHQLYCQVYEPGRCAGPCLHGWNRPGEPWRYGDGARPAHEDGSHRCAVLRHSGGDGPRG
mmetsp:Transcript_14672/g.55514  ORF Transcript_14672/g.55514 Transcript_14672/m.55514 type:complete len:233 (+) Transcript_14672:2810-3508(+)